MVFYCTCTYRYERAGAKRCEPAQIHSCQLKMKPKLVPLSFGLVRYDQLLDPSHSKNYPCLTHPTQDSKIGFIPYQ